MCSSSEFLSICTPTVNLILDSILDVIVQSQSLFKNPSSARVSFRISCKNLGCNSIKCKGPLWPDRQMDLSERVMSSAGGCGVAAAAGCYVPGEGV